MLKPSELLSQKGAWCQGTFAETAQGIGVDAASPEAARWCVMGAMDRASTDEEHRLEMIDKLKTHLYGRWESLSCWNDHPFQTQTQVVETLREIGL